MTYVDIVNNVLRRMREEEVTSVQDTTFSKMVGDFVNDAKKMVEQAWDWSALRTAITVTTSDGVYNYALTGSKDNVKVLSVINDTANVFMEYRPSVWFENKYYNGDAASGPPNDYTFSGVDSNGDTQVDVYPKPDGVYSLRFNCAVRSDDLSADLDTLDIPAQPVIHLTIAMLARERGETGGTSAPEYFSIADRYLSDAIALDAQKHPEELIWYAP